MRSSAIRTPTLRFVRRSIVVAAVVTLSLVAPRAGHAATWYLGAFTGSTAADDADCGSGLGTHPAAHPCATLAYWTGTRAATALHAGDVVRLTGTFGPAASGFHCIIPRADVTYEGRTADDEQPAGFDDARIDAAQTLAYPCHGGAINCRGDSACAGFSRFTLRYLTLANANGVGGEGNQLMPGNTVQTGLVIDHVRFTGSLANGLLIGSGVANENNPCDGVRNVRDVTIHDAQFDHNTQATSQAGLWLTCTDGGSIMRSAAFDNRGADKTADECNEDDDAEGCDGRNGFHFGGWINGVIRDSTAHDNGYYNYNFSGNGPSTLCDAPTHHVLVDRCTGYSAPSANFSFSHCNHDVTVRNTVTWGHGLAVNQYACAYRLRFYNNTFWNPKAMQLFANCRECDFRNNVFHCDTDIECIYVDFATRNALTTWRNNVVVNAGTGDALTVYDSNGECVGVPGGGCDCPGSEVTVCPNSDPQSPGCPAPWKDDTSRHFRNDQLGQFVADAMFGDETGLTDRWGTSPEVDDATTPSPASLHLLATDTVARDAGATVAAALFGDPPEDWDGDRRPQGAAWDIGADEATANPGTCTSDLAQCTGDLTAAQSTAASCAADLAECQALSTPADADHDGRPDPLDRCPGTPSGAATDDGGCSQAQFCGAYDATTPAGKRVCKKADWGNDEPVMKASEADCAVDKGGRGSADDRCVAR